MSFQILDSNGEAITLSILDEQAAVFWGKDVHPKHYATPNKDMVLGNWFDTIGHMIHSPEDKHYTSGWNNVKCSLWTCMIKGEYNKSITDLFVVIPEIKASLKPYYELIDHWESKGYTPKQVNE